MDRRRRDCERRFVLGLAVVGSEKKREAIWTVAFPRSMNLEMILADFAALLNKGVMRRTGMIAVKKRDNGSATCLIKRLGSGCKKRELLKGSVSVDLVHRAFGYVLLSAVPPPSLLKSSGRSHVPACISLFRGHCG